MEARFVFFTVVLCFAEVFCDDFFGEAGAEITFTPVIYGTPEEIVWKHNGDKVVEYDGSEVTAYGAFDGRVHIDFETGQLTIRKLTGQDRGEYSVDMVISGKIKTFPYTLTVLDAFPEPRVTCERDGTSDRYKLECSVDSQIKLTYTWSGPNVKDHAGRELFTDELNTDATVTCTARSDAQHRSSSFSLQDCDSGGAQLGVIVVVVIVIILLICIGFGVAFFFWRQKKEKSKESDIEEDAEKAEEEKPFNAVPKEITRGQVAMRIATYEEKKTNGKEMSPLKQNESQRNWKTEETRLNMYKQTTEEEDREGTERSNAGENCSVRMEVTSGLSEAKLFSPGECDQNNGSETLGDIRERQKSVMETGKYPHSEETGADGELKTNENSEPGDQNQGQTEAEDRQTTPEKNTSRKEITDKEDDDDLAKLIKGVEKMNINETHQQKDDKQTTVENGTERSNRGGNTKIVQELDPKESTNKNGDHLTGEPVNEDEPRSGEEMKKVEEKMDITNTGLSDAKLPSPANVIPPIESSADGDQNNGLQITGDTTETVMETQLNPQSEQTGNGSEGQLETNENKSQSAANAEENTNRKPGEMDIEGKTKEQMETETSSEPKHKSQEAKTDTVEDEENGEGSGDEQTTKTDEDQQITGRHSVSDNTDLLGNMTIDKNGESSSQNEGLENLKTDETSKNKDKKTEEVKDHEGTDQSNTGVAVTDENTIDTEETQSNSRTEEQHQKTGGPVNNEDELKSGEEKTDQTNSDPPANPVTEPEISSVSSSNQTDTKQQESLTEENNADSEDLNEEQKPTQETETATKEDQREKEATN